MREAIRLHAQPADGETRRAAQRRADALVAATRDGDSTGTATPGGVIDTDIDRTVVTAETIRRMVCDCDLHRYITNPLGTVVDYGRAIPAGSCDAHHAIHWLDNGATKPDNLTHF